MAAPFTTLYHLFPAALKEYIKQFPNVELSILDRSQHSVLDHIKNGEIDFGFMLESNVPADLATIRWQKVETVVMAPINHPLTKAQRVTLRQIAKYPLILPPKSFKQSYRSNLETEFQKRSVDYHIIMESSNVELSSVYVEMGIGISFATVVTGLPRMKKRKLKLLPLNHLFKPDYIAVVMRKDKILQKDT